MISKRVVLHFPSQMADQPVIYLMSKEYDLAFNILLARIMPNEEGVMVAELSGEGENYTNGIEYLRSQGVIVELLSRDVRRDEKQCIHCGICTSVCPVEALSIPDRESMKVEFDIDKCVACSICVEACPTRAMHVAINGPEEFNLQDLV